MNLLLSMQSLHSTETALLRVLNYILMTTDSGASAVFCISDLHLHLCI